MDAAQPLLSGETGGCELVYGLSQEPQRSNVRSSQGLQRKPYSLQRLFHGSRSTVEHLHVAWFTASMSTGIVGNAIYSCPHSFTGLHMIADGFLVGNALLFVVLTALLLTRFASNPSFLRTFKHDPQESLMLGAIPMALGTIVQGLALIVGRTHGQWAITLAWVLWWIQLGLSVLCLVGVPLAMFTVQALKEDQLSASWTMPFLPMLVLAISGSTLAEHLHPHNAGITILVSYASWGAGLGLCHSLVVMYLHRLIMFKIPTGEAVVSSFVALSPYAQASYSIVQLSLAMKSNPTALPMDGLQSMGFSAVSNVAGLIIWGLGLWWALNGALFVLVRWQTLSFNLSFWSLIFPFGVQTTAASALARGLPSPFMSYVGTVMVALTFCLWLIIAGRTLYAAASDLDAISMGPVITTSKARTAPASHNNAAANPSHGGLNILPLTERLGTDP